MYIINTYLIHIYYIYDIYIIYIKYIIFLKSDIYVYAKKLSLHLICTEL